MTIIQQQSIPVDKSSLVTKSVQFSHPQLIIQPIPASALCDELTPDRLLRVYKGLQVYIVTAHEAPHVMAEVGRIREVEFRQEGGGTGQAKDIDEFDTGEAPYRQLVVWDPEAQEIVAMYRYILCRDAVYPGGAISLATAEIFTFSERFQQDYLPYAIELGRSVVNRSAKRAFLGLWAVWCGLGALVREYSEMRYFFGKVTMYPTYNTRARDILLHFLHLYCPDLEGLASPKAELQVTPMIDSASLAALFTGHDYQRDYLSLKQQLQELGESIPPLINSYLDVTRNIKIFGTAYNLQFGNVEETALLISINSINEKHRRRYIDSYERINSSLLQRLRTEDLFQSINRLQRSILSQSHLS